jgi:hypothetical protein
MSPFPTPNKGLLTALTDNSLDSAECVSGIEQPPTIRFPAAGPHTCGLRVRSLKTENPSETCSRRIAAVAGRGYYHPSATIINGCATDLNSYRPPVAGHRSATLTASRSARKTRSANRAPCAIPPERPKSPEWNSPQPKPSQYPRATRPESPN